MLHEYGYGYPIQYISETRIHILKRKPTKMVYLSIHILVSGEYRIRIRHPL
jgi:hypothetical protein